MRVLVVTRSIDRDTVERVTRALRARGAEVARLDTDRFPLTAHARIELGPESCDVELATVGGPVRLSEVDAVWIRAFDAGAGLPLDLDPHLRHAAILESRAVLFGVLESLETFCLDPLAKVRRAESKELQLRTARRLGLAIPRTCITNDPQAARAFVHSCPDGAVAKMLEPPRLPAARTATNGAPRATTDGAPHSTTDGAAAAGSPWAGRVLHTTVLDEGSLQHLDALRFCPMVFQERLTKVRELRVTLVGRRAFAAELDSASIPGAESDWRREPARVMPAWKRTELPADVETRLHALQAELGLQYGAVDLVHTPDDRLVFLEVNPGGQYHWLEQHAGLEISQAIADVLSDPSARRPASAELPLAR